VATSKGTDWTRRRFLREGARSGTALALYTAGCRSSGVDEAQTGVWVNDVHSGLNLTWVSEVMRPASLEQLQSSVRLGRASGRPICLAAGRHAMGGQQFALGATLLDLDAISGLDSQRGIIEVGAGVHWPRLVESLLETQAGASEPWGIRQKQTGADELSLGGALAANAHGRGLRFAPMVGDVESFELIDAEGELRTCSRDENPELFRLAIGGYGLFGIVARVRLRLARRQLLERVVELTDTESLVARVEERIAEGFTYGDFQYATDLRSEDALRKGVLACYRPVSARAGADGDPRELSNEEWRELIRLAHVDRSEAFRRYADFYLSTSGQRYWSDTHQLSTYLRDYHAELGRSLGRFAKGSEMITEIYVPRDAFATFMEQARRDFIEHDVELIYGTVRFIEPDEETFLPWARRRWACVIFNLHTRHDAESLRRTAADFRRLIDRAIEHGGSYFLTYHRWAEREQVLACHPRFAEFLRRKRVYDPDERFQSEWYRHYRALFADTL